MCRNVLLRASLANCIAESSITNSCIEFYYFSTAWTWCCCSLMLDMPAHSMDVPKLIYFFFKVYSGVITIFVVPSVSPLFLR